MNKFRAAFLFLMPITGLLAYSCTNSYWIMLTTLVVVATSNLIGVFEGMDMGSNDLRRKL